MELLRETLSMAARDDLTTATEKGLVVLLEPLVHQSPLRSDEAREHLRESEA